MKNQIKNIFGLGLLLAGGVASAEGTKVGGFVAPAFSWAKAGTVKTSTFNVPEGALYFSHSMDAAEVMVDIPFALTGATSNSLSLGGSMTQAYLSHKWSNGLSWKLGRFDRLYGYSPNDLAARTLTQQAALWSMVPTTHTGLVLGYGFSDMLDVNFLFANPANTAVRVTGVKYDLGLQANVKMDAIKASLGWLMGKSGAVTSNLFDVVLGMTQDKMAVDFNFDMTKATGGTAAMGFGLQVKNGFTDTVSGAVRAEWMKDSAKTKTLAVAVGPQFAVTKALEVRADYSLGNSKADGATTSSTSHTVAVAGVYKF